MLRVTLSFLFSFMLIYSLEGQLDIPFVRPPLSSWKDMSKKHKSENEPLLLFVYSQQNYKSQLNTFQKVDSIFNATANTQIASLDLNPYRNSAYRGFPFYKYLKNLKVPAWMYIHPNGALIGSSQNITSDDQLANFIKKCEHLYTSYNQSAKENIKKMTQEELKEVIAISVRFEDHDFASNLLDQYLKKTDTKKISDTHLKELIAFGSYNPYSKRLKNLILNDKQRAINLSSRLIITDILKRYILEDLSDKQLLEPYYVWNRFETDLEYEADSLFRMFMIEYIVLNEISNSPEGVQELYNEIFDYLTFYPRSPWIYLDGLYNFVISRTTKREDLDILLDLISFQIFRERGYKQLDYKAVILYKLGNKDRALKMIEEINRKALESGIQYRSLLHALR